MLGLVWGVPVASVNLDKIGFVWLDSGYSSVCDAPAPLEDCAPFLLLDALWAGIGDFVIVAGKGVVTASCLAVMLAMNYLGLFFAYSVLVALLMASSIALLSQTFHLSRFFLFLCFLKS